MTTRVSTRFPDQPAGGKSVPFVGIVLSGTAQQTENTAIHAAIGVLSVTGGTGTYTFSETADADNVFELNADGKTVQNSAVFDYEVKTSHDVTYHADNGAGSTFDRTFTIAVVNVLEVTLAALSLNTATVDEDDPPGTLIGTIVGKSSGSVITMTDTAGGKVVLSGNTVVIGATDISLALTPTFTFTLHEVHTDGNNSPRDTVITVTVTSTAELLPHFTLMF